MSSETKHLTGRVDAKLIRLLDKISKEEKVDRSAALRKVLDIGIKEYLKRKAVMDYMGGRISIGKAAEEAEVSVAGFYMILANEGVPIKIDATALQDALKSDIRE